GEEQRGAPGAAGQQPAFDAEVLAQPFHVGEQMRRSVAAQVRVGIAGVWRAAPAAALIEQDYAVSVWIEVLTMAGRAPRSGAAVHDKGGLAVRITADLPVHEVVIAHVEHPPLVRLDRGVQHFEHLYPLWHSTHNSTACSHSASIVPPHLA